jgi:hypothetical protein
MGLAAKVPADFIATIKTMGEDHDVNVEDDQEVSINGNDSWTKQGTGSQNLPCIFDSPAHGMEAIGRRNGGCLGMTKKTAAQQLCLRRLG